MLPPRTACPMMLPIPPRCYPCPNDAVHDHMTYHHTPSPYSPMPCPPVMLHCPCSRPLRWPVCGAVVATYYRASPLHIPVPMPPGHDTMPMTAAPYPLGARAYTPDRHCGAMRRGLVWCHPGAGYHTLGSAPWPPLPHDSQTVIPWGSGLPPW